MSFTKVQGLPIFAEELESRDLEGDGRMSENEMANGNGGTTNGRPARSGR